MGLSSTGIGSGLDVATLVSKLMATEQGRTTALDKKEASANAKLSAIGSLKSALSALQQSAQTVNLSTTFSTLTATVADTTAFSASTTGATTAGTYNIAVENLAQSQKLISGGYGSRTSIIGMGTLTLDVGSYSDAKTPPVSFTANAQNAQKTITIDSSNNTLEGIRDAINKANSAVTATIVNDGASFRLSLSSKQSGVENAVRIGVTENGSAGLGQLAFDSSTNAVSKMTQNVAAQDAKITIDGVTVNSASNTLTDAIQGVTLHLTKEMTTGTTTTLTLAHDSTSARTAIEGFVKAYNDVAKQITDSTTYNATTGTASVLTGDSTLRSVQSQLRSALSSAIPGAKSGLAVLSDAGISFQRDGTLAINASKLDTALADPANDLSRLFITSEDGTIGFGARVNTLVSKMIFGTDGTLNGRIDGLNSSIKDISKQRETETLRLTSVQKRYQAQFSALDTLIASMTTTSNFLTQQLASLPKN